MNLFVEGFIKAYQLIFAGAPSVLAPLLLTIQVTGTAILITVLLGLPIGMMLGLKNFRGKQTLVTVVNSAMGLPPVVVGLFVSLVLWRSGILGSLGIMYTPTAIVLAETIISLPLVIGLTFSAVQGLDVKLNWQILALGASKFQLYKKILFETKIAVAAALIAGFGSIISEVGAAMMVGGNIEGQTRVLTTAIVLETRKGNFDVAIALSLILLSIALLINVLLTKTQRQGANLGGGRAWI